MEDEEPRITFTEENSKKINKKIIYWIIAGAVLITIIAFGLIYFFQKINKPETEKINELQTQKKVAEQTEMNQKTSLDEKKKQSQWALEEDILYTVPSEHKIKKFSLTFSSDGKSFAYSSFKEGNAEEFCVINGKEVEWRPNLRDYFDNVSNPANAEKIVYTKQGEKYLLIYKGKKLAEEDDVITGYISSNDKKQFAYYIQEKNGKRLPIVNGEEGPRYEIIGPQNCSGDESKGENSCDRFAFAYDGKQNAYIAKKGSGYVIIVNGKERAIYPKMYSPMFSLDSNHFAYKAFNGSNYFLVIDGEEQKKYDNIFNIKFNADGKLTYNAFYENKIVKVIQNYNPQLDSIEKDKDKESEIKSADNEQQRYDVLNWMFSAWASAHDCFEDRRGIKAGVAGEKICDLPLHTWPKIKICGDNPSDTKWIVANGKSLDWNITLDCKGYVNCNGQVNAICNDGGCKFNKGCDPQK